MISLWHTLQNLIFQPTTSGNYQLFTGTPGLGVIARPHSKLKHPSLKHRQSEGELTHDCNKLRQQTSHSSPRSAAANKTVHNVMNELL